MFDFVQIMELLKLEPGHNLVSSVLLFMIWMSSRGLKKEMGKLSTQLLVNKTETDNKFKEHGAKLDNHETRITTLETRVK